MAVSESDSPIKTQINGGLSHLWKAEFNFSRHTQAWLLPHLFQSRNHLNRTCLTKLTIRSSQARHHAAIQRRNKWETKSLRSISLEKVIKPFPKLWDSREPQWEHLSTNGRNMEQWWKLSRSGRPTKITPRGQRRLIHGVNKRPYNNLQRIAGLTCLS